MHAPNMIVDGPAIADDVRDAADADDVRVAAHADDVRDATRADDVRDATQADDVRDATQADDVRDAAKSHDVHHAAHGDDVRDAAHTEDVRARIVAATAGLIASGGRDAATTRAVASAAAVQAPTIYRLFGDKRGLLDAVADHGLAAYVAAKSVRVPHPDPVEDLRDGWDMHVAFGLAHPGLFSIMSGDTRPRPLSPAVAAGLEVLQRRIRNIALAGRLRMSEERAVALMRSVGVGTVLTLLGQPDKRRDPGLSVAAREAVVAAITGETILTADQGPSGAAAAQGPSKAAAALRASLDRTTVLTGGERHLLEELLDRIADGEQRALSAAAAQTLL